VVSGGGCIPGKQHRHQLNVRSPRGGLPVRRIASLRLSNLMETARRTNSSPYHQHTNSIYMAITVRLQSINCSLSRSPSKIWAEWAEDCNPCFAFHKAIHRLSLRPETTQHTRPVKLVFDADPNKETADQQQCVASKYNNHLPRFSIRRARRWHSARRSRFNKADRTR
jgi:hypothetical protein